MPIRKGPLHTFANGPLGRLSQTNGAPAWGLLYLETPFWISWERKQRFSLPKDQAKTIKTPLGRSPFTKTKKNYPSTI